MRGTEIGGYEVGDVMGATSQLVVYSALRPVASGVTRAVAFLAPRRYVRAEVTSTFALAAEVFSKTSHPVLLPIEDFGRPGGPLFAVGPRLSGMPLCRLLGGITSRVQALSEEAAMNVAVRMVQAARTLVLTLDADHVVQVSPEVVWLTAQGHVYLLPTAIRRRRAIERANPSAQDESLASEISALLWDLLLMGRTRPPRKNEWTGQVAEIVNPSLFQLVLDMLSSSSNASADRFLRAFDSSCQTPPELASELASIVRSHTLASLSPDDESVTALRRSGAEESGPEPTRMSAGATAFRLRVVGTGRPQRVLVLDPSRSRWVVGRSSAADLVIEDANMSREHFAIIREPDGTFSICDLGSKNGLMINGRRRAPGTIQPGDEVRAGTTVFCLESHVITAGCDGTGRRMARAVGSRPL